MKIDNVGHVKWPRGRVADGNSASSNTRKGSESDVSLRGEIVTLTHTGTRL